MSKRSAADVEKEDADGSSRAYNYYAEHKRTAAMSERKIKSFRKKNRIGVRCAAPRHNAWLYLYCLS